MFSIILILYLFVVGFLFYKIGNDNICDGLPMGECVMVFVTALLWPITFLVYYIGEFTRWRE